MSRERRIPARDTQAYASWSLPAVEPGTVIRAQAARAVGHRLAEATQAEPVRGGPLEQQLAANIRAGRFARGVSARELEAIVRDAALEGRQEGHREGYAQGQQEGFADGRAEGLAAARKYLEEAAGRFASLLQTLQQPLLEQERELREVMLELITRIARGVVRAELTLAPQHIARVVDEALAALPLGARHVRVWVSPADRELLEDFGTGDAVPTLLVDPALEPGGCRVESAESLVDFTVSARFAELIGQLPGSAAARRGENG